jgi:uncharacterized protein involved in exopolysaccharide biosynthesis
VEPYRERIEDFMRRYGLVLVVVVLAAVGVSSASYLQTPTYEASAQVWVGQKQGAGNGKIQLIPNAPTPETLQTGIVTMIIASDSRPVAADVSNAWGYEWTPTNCWIA